MGRVLAARNVSFPAEAEVLIVGAGAAGLVAALRARAAGAEVVLLERDRVPRGSTALSAGLIPAAGTRAQARAGIADDPGRFATDILAKAHGEPDPLAVRALTEAIGRAVDWLEGEHGLAFSVIDDFAYPGHSAHRIHGLAARSGEALVDALAAAAERAGAALLCEAHVTALFADDDGRVRGVEIERPDGSAERIGCGTLILACNGYGGDPGLVAEHIPELAGALYFGHPGNQGDALRWGAALGAASRDLSGHQGHGSVAHPHGVLLTWATMTEGGFQANAGGLRFHDESRGYSEAAAEVLAQPGGVAWSVFDARIAGIARQFEDFRRLEAMGALLAAEKPQDLARRAGLPEVAFAETFATFETAKRGGGTADPFGRRPAGLPPLAAPLHAVKVTGALFHTQGGLVVDERARVLRADGSPLPNLFAAGGAACGVSGATAAGYLSGNGLLSAVGYGYIAGNAAAELVHRHR
jgi:fumarate reductase flavoprotein subunit